MKKVQELKHIEDDKEMVECSFKPATNKKILKGERLSSPPPKFQGLDKLSLPLDRQRQREKSSHELDYEKNKDECTFKPQLIAKDPKKNGIYT